MKISLGKFYAEVTGKTTGNLSTITLALKRWGIPFDETSNKTDRVEVRFLDAAKAKWQEEQTAREASKVQRAVHPGSGDAAHMQKMRDARASKRIDDDKLKAIHATLVEIRDAVLNQGTTLGRMESILNQIHKDLYGDKKT